MRLALDTNAYRLLMDHDPGITELMREADLIALPVPVVAELRYGFLNGNRARANEATLNRFIDQPRVEVWSVDEETTHLFASLRLQLKKAGRPIPMNDIWIAAVVLQHRGVLATRDRDFEHIPQLPRV